MDIIGNFAARLISELTWLVDWAIGNWAVTIAVLAALIYWAGRQRRLNRHHL
ncbi:MAG: hypothetical protein ACREQ2_26775 [Candidatus Binatia bacterium]